MKSGAYFRTILKKAARLYPLILFITVGLLLAVFAALYLTVSNGDGEQADTQKVNIGLVGNTSGTYLGIGLDAVKSVDTIHYSVELINVEEEEANRMLRNGELDGYLIIPNGFVTGIERFENIPLKFVVMSDANTFGSLLIREVADAIASLVTESQSAMYSMESLARTHDVTSIGTLPDGSDDKLEMHFIDFILKRERVYGTTVIERPDSLSTPGYYLCSGIMIMLLMWGISCSALLSKKDRSMERLLCSRGIGTFSQIITEYLCFFAVTFVTFALLSGAGGVILTKLDGVIPELSKAKIYGGLVFALKCVPAMLAVSSIHFLIYEAFGSGVPVILSQFFITVIIGYISGCFFPDSFFPASVRKISSVLPWGMSLGTMKAALLNKNFALDALILVLFSCAALFACFLIRRREVNA